jgi:hypothetical protein
MHTTFFFVLLVYYVYNYMFLHLFKTLLSGYCYEVVWRKESHALQPFSDLLCIPIWVLIIPDSSTRDLLQILAEKTRANQDKLRENGCEFSRRTVTFILRRVL